MLNISFSVRVDLNVQMEGIANHLNMLQVNYGLIIPMVATIMVGEELPTMLCLLPGSFDSKAIVQVQLS